ncbi:Uncharacterised protein [Mycobacteroides abscessus subsp. abscessus]|nr:Uncharacterised protein [Mycobacteroides abscessus subsp. abscessus]
MRVTCIRIPLSCLVFYRAGVPAIAYLNPVSFAAGAELKNPSGLPAVGFLGDAISAANALGQVLAIAVGPAKPVTTSTSFLIR